mmetsp:Transcript_37284/g.85359  ORF Transcript_37284/g.85359 Transcript_37284/m.85359 type:complete len:92 (+) Transcript_37284:766-1041(+)
MIPNWLSRTGLPSGSASTLDHGNGDLLPPLLGVPRDALAGLADRAATQRARGKTMPFRGINCASLVRGEATGADRRAEEGVGVREAEPPNE